MLKDKPVYLVVTPFFPSKESFRGPYVYDQVKAIMKDGRYRVVVMMPGGCLRKHKDYEYDGVCVFRFAQYELPTNAWPGIGDCISFHSFDKALKRVGITYKDIAVVHAHVTANAKYANYVKLKNSLVKAVLQHHGYDVLSLTDGRFANNEWHKRLCVNYGVNLCNQIDLHVGVSEQIFHYLESFKDLRLKDRYVLYNGVDITKFYRIEKNHAGFHIGCVANFWELKDQITLIKAVELLINKGHTDIRVSLVGTGYTRESCEKYVYDHALADYFEFKNEVDHRQLNAYYNTLDLFVLPSYWDAFGCVYTEAYACGVPFMAATGSGITEYIQEDDLNYWVIEPHDYQSLARNISYYMNHRKKQVLKYPVDINELIKPFLNYLMSR